MNFLLKKDAYVEHTINSAKRSKKKGPSEHFEKGPFLQRLNSSPESPLHIIPRSLLHPQKFQFFDREVQTVLIYR